MAGGPFAEFMVCMTCSADGVVTRATRVYEGAEDDHYVCEQGHQFGVDWSRGPPEELQWPPSPEMASAIEPMREPEVRLLAPDTTVRRFVVGAALRPADELRAWLAANAGRRLRLPVVLGRGVVGFSLRGARIGGEADALTIRCDDCALGIGLADRARQAAGAAATCALWLEGFWRGGEDDPYLAVVKVGERIGGDELATVGAEIEEAAEVSR